MLRPEYLPPTENSAKYHVMRVHLQVLHWKSLSTAGFSPQEWGWHLSDGRYQPITSNVEPTPMELLNIVRVSVILTAGSHVGQCYVPVGSMGYHVWLHAKTATVQRVITWMYETVLRQTAMMRISCHSTLLMSICSFLRKDFSTSCHGCMRKSYRLHSDCG